ncbi:MAG: hypothetical protein C0597_09550, partial [Marinilabiliales bacterium]
MNNNGLNIDQFTREIVGKASIEQPGSDFTKNVMAQILKNPAVKVSFITNDDRKSNIWLILSMTIMVVGFFIFYFIKYGFDLNPITDGFKTSTLFTIFLDFFTRLWNEISLSPYILIALICV